MANLFEDQTGVYLVLVNDEGQHSLWPETIAVPAGWRVVHGPAPRDQCLAYVDDNWTDMRPASLIRSSDARGI